MRRAHGYAIAKRDGIITEEHDTFSCAHCGNEFFVRPGKDVATDKDAIEIRRPGPRHDGVGGVCLQCSDGFTRGLVCPSCEKEQARTGKCVPFEKRLEAYERRSRMLSAIGVQQ